MIGYWQCIPSGAGRRVRVSLGAHVGGCDLIVERRNGERAWRWRAVSPHGHLLEAGTAPDAASAERLAEDAAFHIHPPTVGDWVEQLL